MINEPDITANLVSDMQKIGENAHLFEQAQDLGNSSDLLNLLSDFEESLESILEEVKILKDSSESLFFSDHEELFYECA